MEATIVDGKGGAPMDAIRKILVPTDLSDLSREGVRYALEMGKAVGAEVLVHHIVPYEDLGVEMTGMGYHPVDDVVRDRERMLGEFLRENFGELLRDVRVRQGVVLGRPYQRILDTVVDEGVDLIVMSTHGRTGIGHMLLGSVTERVVREARCPVLSVRPRKAEQEGSRMAA
jgi:nucleotide-binding universal stress UspA family protein